MATIKLFEHGRYALWVDGFIPSLEELDTAISECFVSEKPYVDRIKSGKVPKDKVFSELFYYQSRNMKPNKMFLTGDVFLLKPKEKIPFPYTYLPPYQEYSREGYQDNYRVLIAIYPEEVGNKAEGVLLKVLKRLRFRVKMDSEYSDPKQLKSFAKDLLYEVISKYAAPCGEAEKELKKMGFSCELGDL